MPIRFVESKNQQKEKDSLFKTVNPVIPAVLCDENGFYEDGDGNAVDAQLGSDENYVWVRTYSESTPQPVLNMNVVPPVGGIPIYIGFPEGAQEIEVLGINKSALTDEDLVEVTTGHAREHEPGGFDQMFLYRRMFNFLRLIPSVGLYAPLTVSVSSLEYDTGTGERQFFAGESNFDLTSYSPSVGMKVWVLVYLDSETNYLDVVSGSEVVNADPIPAVKPDTPVGGIPSAYVLLKDGMIYVTEEDIADARRVLNDPYSAGGVWPEPGEIKIGTVSYDTIQDAIDDANAGDLIKVGEGDYDEQLTIDVYQLSIIGIDPIRTRISSSTYETLVTIEEDEIYIQGIGIYNTHSAAISRGILFVEGFYTNTLREVYVTMENSSYAAYGLEIEDDVEENCFWDCVVTAPNAGGIALYLNISAVSSYVDLYGGRYDGATYSVGATSSDGEVYLYGGVTFWGGERGPDVVLHGHYFDPEGEIRYAANNSPSDGDVPIWNDANQQWTPGAIPAGWPYDNVVTVSQTNADADYATITAALAGINAGDIILLDAGTYSEFVTVDVSCTIIGLSPEDTIVNAGNFYTITLSPGAVDVTLVDMTLTNTLGSGLYITSATNLECYNVKIASASYATYHPGSTIAKLYNCEFVGSNAYYMDDDSAGEVHFYGGYYEGSAVDVFFGDNGVGYFYSPVLHNGTITPGSGGSTHVVGRAVNEDGNMILVHDMSPSDGQVLTWNTANSREQWESASGSNVWPAEDTILIDGDATVYTDLQTAITAASAGDYIRIGAGTFVLPTYLVITKNVILIGSGKDITNLTLSSSTLTEMIYFSGTSLIMKYMSVAFVISGTGAKHMLHLASGSANLQEVEFVGYCTVAAGTFTAIRNGSSGTITCDGVEIYIDGSGLSYLYCLHTLSGSGTFVSSQGILATSGAAATINAATAGGGTFYGAGVRLDNASLSGTTHYGIWQTDQSDAPYVEDIVTTISSPGSDLNLVTEKAVNDKCATPAVHASTHEDGGSDEISVDALSGELADAQKVAVSKNSGVVVGTRPELNFIEGSNITLTVADDAGSDEIDITIASSGGTSSVDLTHVSLTSALNIPGGWNDVVFNNEVADPNNYYSTVNGRFTPTTAGWYRVTTTLRWAALTAGDSIYGGVGIAKNGTLQSYVIRYRNITGTVFVAHDVECNGSTDYITVQARQNDSASEALTANGQVTWAQFRYLGT